MALSSVGKWYWHIHHGILAEVATEDIRLRRSYIRKKKPEWEIALRLRLLKPIRGKIPSALTQATLAFLEAKQAVRALSKEDREALMRRRLILKRQADAHDAYLDERRKAKPYLEALHRKECPNCPWDGSTIFPSEREEGKYHAQSI